MKRIFAFLLLFVPNVIWADACTNPNEYTIDKRCYVTEEQKKEKPYISVVGIMDNEDAIYCTGTVILDQNDELSIYTAKHCTDVNQDNVYGDNLRFITQNGDIITGRYKKIGDYDVSLNEYVTGDWAIYSIDNIQKNILSTNITNNKRIYIKIPLINYSYNRTYDARLIGYGALKIMSDQEIKEIKQKYINYLQKNNLKQPKYEIEEDGIMFIHDASIGFLKYLLEQETNYYQTIFADKILKVSYCKIASMGGLQDCKGWGGNSGGGVFDDEGNMMGIVTRGGSGIGGNVHARIGGAINYLK
jgi:hypothetical protein